MCARVCVCVQGGSEVWTTEKSTVIASLAFHPTDQVLVIATYNEIYFWDWFQPQPFAKICTADEKEKVRCVCECVSVCVFGWWKNVCVCVCVCVSLNPHYTQKKQSKQGRGIKITFPF